MFGFENLRRWTVHAGVAVAIPFSTIGIVRCQTTQEMTLKWQNLVLQSLDLDRQGDIAGAEAVLTSALDVARSLPDADVAVPVVLNNLGALYHELGRRHDAERAYREAVRRLEAKFGAHTGMLATPLCGLVTLHVDAGDTARARREARRLEALVDSPDVGPTELMRIHSVQARVLQSTGRLAEAAAKYVHALSIAETSPEVQRTELATALNSVGAVELDLGDVGNAREHFARAVRIFAEIHGQNTPLLISPLLNLATADWTAKDFRSSEQRLERALSISQRVYGDDSAQTVEILTRYAAVLRQNGRKREAKLASSRARAVALPPENEPGRYTVDVESLRNQR